MAYLPLCQGALQIPFRPNLLPESFEVLLCLFKPETGFMLFVFQEQLNVCLNGLQVVSSNLFSLLILATQQYAFPVGLHDAEVGTLYKTVDVVLPVAGQVNIVGLVTKSSIQSSEKPAKPVVGFDVVVRVFKPLRTCELNV